METLRGRHLFLHCCRSQGRPAAKVPLNSNAAQQWSTCYEEVPPAPLYTQPRQSHTYAFHAVHTSHLVTAQCHERFKHIVQHLGRQRQTRHQVSAGSALTPPDLESRLCGLSARVRSPQQPSGHQKPLGGEPSQGKSG